MDYEKNIETLNERVNHCDKKIARLESSKDFLQDIIKKNVEAYEKLADTLQEVKISMTTLNDKMESQVEAMKKMESQATEQNKKINDRITIIDNKLEEFEDKSKFDILLFIKRNWVGLLSLISFTALAISAFIKN